MREAKQLARNMWPDRPADTGVRPFRYEVIGTLASIGHRTGVGVVFGVRVRGWLAWFMWRGYY